MAAICLAAILAFRIDPTLLSLPFIDRSQLETYFSRVADGVWYPEYPRFLQDVYAHTQRGDSIAIVVPPMEWDKGYSYAYYRASYYLPGRVVLPLVLPNNRMLPQNFQAAKYVAVWRKNFPRGRRSLVWEGSGGVLLRR